MTSSSAFDKAPPLLPNTRVPIEPDHLVTVAAAALSSADRSLAEEQAPHGIDAFHERQLHTLLADAYQADTLGVFREVCYPGAVEKRKRLNARDRCDLVLTESPGVPLLDPVEELRAIDRANGTLFEADAAAIVEPFRVTEVEEAYWLELKAVHAIKYVDGVPRPNPRGAAQAVDGPAADLIKLALEPRIEHAGAMLILFGPSIEQLEDMPQQIAHALLDKHAPTGGPITHSLPIQDHAGNAACLVALFPARL